MGEFNGAIVGTHNLTGEGETDAGTIRLGGEERNEDLFLALGRDWGAIVADMNQRLFVVVDLSCDADMMSIGLQSILDKVDEDATYLRLVSIDKDVIDLRMIGLPVLMSV